MEEIKTYKINTVSYKKEWEDFLTQCDEKTFLQSWNWGEFQKSLGYKIWRFGVYENQALISVALVILHRARRASFLLVPHGPVVMKHGTWNMEQVMEILLEKLKDLANQEKVAQLSGPTPPSGVDFIRINPIWQRTLENEKLFKDLGFRLRALHTHPESSWKLNIEKPEAQILDSMRKTTRYLILKAQKDTDLEIFQSNNIADIEIFNQMHLEVVKTQKFVPFSLEYFKKEFSAFLPDNQIAIFFAKYKGQIIAASYGIFWSGRAFYHHAALLPEYKKIPASYLLQWHAIKEAKKQGCSVYDFWGYSDPVKYPKHPYSGPTLFKMGFGGYKEEYVKAQDFVISKKYWLNYIIETIRRIKRGL